MQSSRFEGSFGLRSASIAATIVFPPNRFTVSATKPGSRNAAEEMTTFFAPASSAISTSARLRMPPPTVTGIFTAETTSRSTSNAGARFSNVAAMSSNPSSSAPDSS